MNDISRDISTSMLWSDSDQGRLGTMLAGDLLILEEPEFIEQCGCPPGQLEVWLSEAWVQHDIATVLEGREKAGARACLLLRRGGQEVRARLFSPTAEALHADLEQQARTELREAIQRHSFTGSAQLIGADIRAVAHACAVRQLPTIEVSLLWQATALALEMWLALKDGPYEAEMRDLGSAIETLRRRWQAGRSVHRKPAMRRHKRSPVGWWESTIQCCAILPGSGRSCGRAAAHKPPPT
jgi:hypothetical protein